MTNTNDPPFIVLSAIFDAKAGAAALTRQHGEAYERAIQATDAQPIAGIDLVELPIAPASFSALRKALHLGEDTVALYDLFALAHGARPELRKVAGQFLAAEVLWTLDKQSLLSGAPLSIKLEVPKGWDPAPEKVSEKLKSTGALTISESAQQCFKHIKSRWDQLQSTS